MVAPYRGLCYHNFTMTKSVIFSGIQPTGNLHVGNYLGAVRNWVALQNSGQHQCYFCIVDYHSLTGNMTTQERQERTLVTAAELLALGIDPDKSTFFIQSHVPETTELAWIFNTITPVAELERMTQFKDKSGRQVKNINAGLLTYPILQAADILLYHGNTVPVGQDQIQHIELTRVIARLFNNRYGEYFSEVKHLVTETPKVMSLLEPTKKMSKSLGAGHVIELYDTPDMIEKKLKRAVTATEGGSGAPGAENLLLLLKQFGDKNVHAQFVAAEKAGTIRYGQLKLAVATAIGNHFANFRERRADLLKNPQRIKAILEQGAAKARLAAQKTIAEVRERVGVR